MPRIVGVVLAGGESRRMGRDKAMVELDGKPLLARVLERLDAVVPAFQELLIVGDRPQYHDFGVRLLPDLYPESGPLGGILTALVRGDCDYAFVVACDMPLLNPELIGAMLVRDADADVVVPRRNANDTSQGPGGVYEALHALYRVSCVPAIERRLGRGDRQVVQFFEDVDVVELTEPWMRQYDPELKSLLNVNRPEDLEAVLASERCH